MNEFASANYTAGQLNAMVKLLKKQGGEEGPERFLRGELTVFEQARPKLNEDGIFRLVVDYNQSLKQMIAAGRYDWVNSDITAKRFPIVGESVVEFEARYFHFDRYISSDDAEKEIESADAENPWMPAKIEHELAHGKTFPDKQLEFPIVGLGSVAKVSGRRRVSCLFKVGSKRDLRLIWWGCDWGPDSRFLAVRKVSGTQS